MTCDTIYNKLWLQISCAKGSLNQIPAHCTVSGDIRVTPFYDCKQIIKDVTSYVAEVCKLNGCDLNVSVRLLV